jgi:hypothetical protein
MAAQQAEELELEVEVDVEVEVKVEVEVGGLVGSSVSKPLQVSCKQ